MRSSTSRCASAISSAALAELPERPRGRARREGEAYFELGEGVALGLVEADTDLDYDLDHVALRSADPEATASEYELARLPRLPRPARRAARAWRSAARGSSSSRARRERRSGRSSTTSPCSSTRPTSTRPRARDLGVEIDNVVDAANTLAVFVWGPERVRIEYVEHKPTFSLT